MHMNKVMSVSLPEKEGFLFLAWVDVIRDAQLAAGGIDDHLPGLTTCLA